jgi:hypothetical protein
MTSGIMVMGSPSGSEASAWTLVAEEGAGVGGVTGCLGLASWMRLIRSLSLLAHALLLPPLPPAAAACLVALLNLGDLGLAGPAGLGEAGGLVRWPLGNCREEAPCCAALGEAAAAALGDRGGLACCREAGPALKLPPPALGLRVALEPLLLGPLLAPPAGVA